MHVLMLAAENDALPGGKVGGLGDVIRDLPPALARAGHRVTVITPGYGVFSALPGATHKASLDIQFGGHGEQVELYELTLPESEPGVTTLILEHGLLAAGQPGRIYINDDEGPFATDAHRFALTCLATAELLLSGIVSDVDCVHCHDWHTGPYFFLRRFSERYQLLQDVPAVFTAHNLSLQGIRPFRGHWSALEAWFPGVAYSADLLTDTRYHDCVNLMRTCINLSDRVSTVSPTYAEEITRASDWSHGRAGGDGLEADLLRLANEGRLLGILNGCDYETELPDAVPPAGMWPLMEKQLDRWAVDNRHSASYYFALKQLTRLRRRQMQPSPILIAISRLTFQKMGILAVEHEDGIVMDAVLKKIPKGQLVLLGDGDEEYDRLFTDCMRRHDNFIYLCGYSASLADTLYASGDLFLMPSVFEPCGISQMLAMRAGMPCLVHQTGGLNDTVHHGENGFSFGGETLQDKGNNLLAVLDEALLLFRKRPGKWKQLTENAAATRFSWEDAVHAYVDELYQPAGAKTVRAQ